MGLGFPNSRAQAICEEKHIWDLDMGSEEHMKSVFEGLKWSRVFTCKQDRVKLGRWASWFNANRAWRGQKQPLLLILCYMGVRKGWFTSMGDLPIFSSTQTELTPEELNPEPEELPRGAAPDPKELPRGAAPPSQTTATTSTAAAASSEPKELPRGAAPEPLGSSSGSLRGAEPKFLFGHPSGPTGGPSDEVPLAVADAGQAGRDVGLAPCTVKESNQELKKIRAASMNTLHFVSKVLGNKYGNKVCECIDMATSPSCQFFDEGKTRCKTVMGKREWQMWLANGGYQDIMRQTMHIFNDPEAMRTIGFIPGMAYEMVDPALAEQDGNLAQLLLKLCMAECYTFLLSTMTWSFQIANTMV